MIFFGYQLSQQNRGYLLWHYANDIVSTSCPPFWAIGFAWALLGVTGIFK